MQTKTLIVPLSNNRSYPIYIGENLLQNPDIFANFVTNQNKSKNKKIMIVTNTTIEKIYLNTLQNTLAKITPKENIFATILPDGENYKNWETLQKIFDNLLANFFDRKSLIIALGGGVIGDMTGFAAACFQRGVDFLQIPTTLLSQVDSSVGGKTAINHPLGKNMIGAFYQPKAVFADIKTLQTLPKREISAGLAEILKYGFINDAPFLEFFTSENFAKIFDNNADVLSEIIYKSCQNKADIVAKDETESSDKNLRALLNFGHTFGHAIETHFGYGTYLHGEAVAIGAMMAAEFSQNLGFITPKEVAKIQTLLNQAKLPTALDKKVNANDLYKLMFHDKKVQNGTLNFVLLKNLGEAFVYKLNSAEENSTLIIKSIEKFIQ